ncbi:hypothetical protein [Clostridium culturomicium]|uniref:hypothetical protein n=1 Tax=Clostridium culturomicium TaxID=1499683 RepID=UPI00059023BA|nr:hypothetical protein [Clostridium culturomicium]
MAITLTEKFAKKVDERFKAGSLSNAGVNHDYSFEGAKTIKITSVPTVPMNDYSRVGSNRYGNPTELQNEIQEATLTQDKSFTFTIDKMNEEETMIKASEALARQIDQEIIPMIDTYRFEKIAEGAEEVIIVAKKPYEAVLDATEKMDEALVPQEGRILYVKNSFYKGIKLDPSFVLASESGMSIKFKGQVGEIDGFAVIKVPANRMPEGVEFIACHPCATCAADKLQDYIVHMDAPGYNGALVEGRVYYDAFKLNNKEGAVVVGKPAV